MNNEKNLLPDLWEYLQSKKLNKTEQKVYNWLNCDNLNAIQADNNIFYFEKICSWVKMPNYIFEWLKKWTTKRYKLIYLYDVSYKY